MICYSVHPSSRQQRHIPAGHDGPQVARVLRHYLTQQNVDVLPWPAVSPDLSSIELVWDEMERPLRYLQNQ